MLNLECFSRINIKINIELVFHSVILELQTYAKNTIPHRQVGRRGMVFLAWYYYGL